MSLEFFRRKKNSNLSFRRWEIDSQKSQAITTQKFWMKFDLINEIELDSWNASIEVTNKAEVRNAFVSCILLHWWLLENDLSRSVSNHASGRTACKRAFKLKIFSNEWKSDISSKATQNTSLQRE